MSIDIKTMQLELPSDLWWRLLTEEGEPHVEDGNVPVGGEGVKLEVRVVHQGQEVFAAANLLIVERHGEFEVAGVVGDPQLEGRARVGVKVSDVRYRLMRELVE